MHGAQIGLRSVRKDVIEEAKKMAKDKELGISEDQEKEASLLERRMWVWWRHFAHDICGA